MSVKVWSIKACIAEARAQERDNLCPYFCRFMEATANHLKALQDEVFILRAALVGLVGADDKEELEHMEDAMRALPVPEHDKAATVLAIQALLATNPK
ncbi:hypothetical protein [Ralstonia solanacearum]|uniref:hypothetical protein n=1 Tax=Ralstonia solanacearum TaxID=305 RepID=UPI001E2C7685|nr:hypothetical protein [Ralstonia solanacearum]